jgi:hypothetical protein
LAISPDLTANTVFADELPRLVPPMVHLPAALPMRIELVLGIHQLDVGKKEQERSSLLQHVDIGLGAILDRFD